MKDFRQAAIDHNAGSFATAGREKMDVDLVIAAYPDGITVTGADLISYEDNDGKNVEYAAVNFKEDPTKYFNAGSALTGIVKDWFEGYQDYETMSKDLAAAGGVKVKMSKTRTKKGNNFTEVTII